MHITRRDALAFGLGAATSGVGLMPAYLGSRLALRRGGPWLPTNIALEWIDPTRPETVVGAPYRVASPNPALASYSRATVTKRLYPGMGHLVNDDEIAFARAMMDLL